ncbi:hypothetical protein C5167_022258 [Papaver somniferum]|uniref:Uncharacterized protein n=1 Tax=Papaver somniferum TaxID=3469 RepID=A0A4Y7JL43_PAPSO|nr:hypothetical protein C5167_022258 [Papaver somniferum]
MITSAVLFANYAQRQIRPDSFDSLLGGVVFFKPQSLQSVEAVAGSDLSDILVQMLKRTARPINKQSVMLNQNEDGTDSSGW